MATRERVLDARQAGRSAVEPAATPVGEDTRWDLASLTKPLGAGPLVALAMQGGLDIGSAPGRFLAGWKSTRYDGITIEMLLTHTSGLAPWFPLYTQGEGPVAYRRTLSGLHPEQAPGAAVIYSDLSFLVLGEVLEAFFSAPVDRAFSELVAQPLGSAAAFRPEDPLVCAATEADDATERRMTAELGLAYQHFRAGVVRGQVHDGNAYRRGGASAHAGLFGTALDVWKLAVPWLDGARLEMARDRTPGLSEARGLAWQGIRGSGSVSPATFSDRAFGHTGFTGTSVWIDPEDQRIFILLTNRVHPRIETPDFNAVRRRFHARVAAAPELRAR